MAFPKNLRDTGNTVTISLTIEHTLQELFFENVVRLADAYLDTVPEGEREQVRGVLLGFAGWIEAVLNDEE